MLMVNTLVEEGMLGVVVDLLVVAAEDATGVYLQCMSWWRGYEYWWLIIGIVLFIIETATVGLQVIFVSPVCVHILPTQLSSPIVLQGLFQDFAREVANT